MTNINKLTPKTSAVLNYVRDQGGRASIADIAEFMGVTAKSAGANVTDLTKREFAERVKEIPEGAEKASPETTFCVLTDAGMAWTAPVEE